MKSTKGYYMTRHEATGYSVMSIRAQGVLSNNRETGDEAIKKFVGS